MSFQDEVRRTIEKYRMFQPGARIAVAVSGGADSVCLLHVLMELEWDLQLSVLHVDHQLRGAESRADAEFVREMASRLRIPCEVKVVELPPGNVEQEGRRARLTIFREHPADRIALGHTRNDQAETVLFRFLRGSGTAGIAGILPVTADRLVRPLIESGRAEVEAYLRERGIAWREDSTNAGKQFARNRIRHGLLPQLADQWNPEIVPVLAHAAEIAQGEEEYWRTEIQRVAGLHLMRQAGAVLIRTDALGRLPVAAARRLVRYAIRDAKGDLRRIDFGHVEKVLELARREEGSGRVQAPGVEIRRSFDWLRIGSEPERPSYSMAARVPGIVRIPGTNTGISLELIEKSETIGPDDNVYNTEMGCLDWQRLSGSLELRNWRPGDRYQPIGSPGADKLKTLFQLQRIPAWERPGWPVLTDGRIVWTRRFGVAAELAAGPDSRAILRIREVTIHDD